MNIFILHIQGLTITPGLLVCDILLFASYRSILSGIVLLWCFIRGQRYSHKHNLRIFSK